MKIIQRKKDLSSLDYFKIFILVAMVSVLLEDIVDALLNYLENLLK